MQADRFLRHRDGIDRQVSDPVAYKYDREGLALQRFFHGAFVVAFCRYSSSANCCLNHPCWAILAARGAAYCGLFLRALVPC